MNAPFASHRASAAGMAENPSVSVATEFPAPVENPAPASGFVAAGTYKAPAPDLSAAAPRKGGAGYFAVKRFFDILFSAGVCIVLAVPVALACVAIEVDSPGKPFFRQERIGKDGKRIYIFKLRTMVSDAHDHPEKYMTTEQLAQWQREQKVDKDPRITRVGRFLRRTSLDELPQFINVLTGDMSVVGPRPALPNETATYNDYQRQRLLVKPGMTCYWQIRRNRDSITFDEWVDLDLWERPTSSGPTARRTTSRCCA